MALAGGRMQRTYAPGDMLDNRHFALAIGVAFTLHLIVLGVWMLLPKTEVIDVPVRPLTVKLGEVSLSAEDLRAIAPNAANNSEVERTISRLVADAPRFDATVISISEISKAAADQAVQKHLANPDSVKQFVRAPSTEATVNDARYEQLVSMWIQKFKVYPKEAIPQALSGESAIHVRIDRRGNIRHYMLQRSTGSDVLDRAAIEMVRRANPVPAVPNDYPAGEEFEFLIPVSFQSP